MWMPRVAVVGPPVSLTAGRYLLGWLVLALVISSITWGCVQLRRALVPWTGAPARLAEIVIGLTTIVLVSYLLGTIGTFRGPAVLVAFVFVGTVLGVIGQRLPHGLDSTDPEPVPLPRSSRVEVVGAMVGVTIVAAQWLSHVASTFGRGMTATDTLWYHAVFALQFVQSGRLDFIPGLGTYQQGYFPANSQMFHALAYFPFDRDLLSPIVNLGFCAIVLLAAYCIGRRRGLGALCVLGAAAMLNLPVILEVHAGQASNDLVGAALLLVAVALLIEGGLHPVPIALSSAAAALAMGTKLTVLLPIAALTVALVVSSVRERRRSTAFTWLGVLLTVGAYWFIRNWVIADNPLPWYGLSVGPIHLPRTVPVGDDASVADYLTTRAVYGHVWIPGLHKALGVFWPAIVGSPLLAGLLMVGRDRRHVERLAGLVTLVAGLAYVLTPITMELDGAAFATTVRYGSPALLLGLALIPLSLSLYRASVGLRALVVAAFGAVIALNAVALEWVSHAPWAVHDRPLAIALALVGLGLVTAWMIGPRVVKVGVVALVLVLAIGGGAVVQRHYLAERYVAAGLPLDEFYEYLQDREPTRIVAFGTFLLSPLFGPHDTNHVEVLRRPWTGASPADPVAQCELWKRAIAKARPNYLLFSNGLYSIYLPDATWFRTDPDVQTVLTNPRGTLARVNGRISLDCSSANIRPFPN